MSSFTLIFCILSAITVPIWSNCPRGWVSFHQSCYFFSHSVASWHDASSDCLALHSELVVVESIEEDQFIIERMKQFRVTTLNQKRFWMDGTDMTEEGYWIWASTLQPFVYKNWAPNEPNGYQGHDEDCLEIGDVFGYRWNSNPCDDKLYFICERKDDTKVMATTHPATISQRKTTVQITAKERVTAEMTTTQGGALGTTSSTKATNAPVTVSCPSGWLKFQQSCYFFSVSTASWLDSSSACKAKQSELVAVETAAENTFLVDHIRKTGGRKPNTRFWTGGNDLNSEGHWIWTSTSQPLTYFNWLEGEPTNQYDGHQEDCLEIGYISLYKWNDNLCDEKLQYICELNIRQATAAPLIG